MINYIVKYFTLNRRERNGIMLLISLIFILLIAKYFIVYHSHTVTSKIAVVELDSVAAKLAAQEMLNPEKNYSSGFTKAKKDSLFYFDPNTVTEQQAIKLGFSEKGARTFMNYRNKGAQFRKAEDLKKLYGMTDRLYEKIEPYVSIAKNISKEGSFMPASPQKNSFKKQEDDLTLEINSADSLQWLKLKGIGPGYTHKILKYKSLLGGYIQIEQLKEVYGFTDSLFTLIKPHLTINTALVQKLKVNSVDFKTMVHHPYIKYEGTKCIFALKRNKKIKADDLINSSCFSREMLQKVLLYLDFEE